MTRFAMLAGSVALLSFMWGCATPPPPDTRAADEQVIRQNEAEALKAATAKDLERLVSFYADDASVFMPGAPAVTGKDAIRESWGELFAAPGSSISFQPVKVEVSRSSDLAYCYGTYTMTVNGPKGKPMSAKGNYVEVYKKQPDGKWKLVVDIGNSALPSPAAARAPARVPAKKRRR